jgi:hypothetical protein
MIRTINSRSMRRARHVARIKEEYEEEREVEWINLTYDI